MRQPLAVFGRAECLDTEPADIHQAAERLAARAGADQAASRSRTAGPIFAALRLALLKGITKLNDIFSHAAIENGWEKRATLVSRIFLRPVSGERSILVFRSSDSRRRR